MLRHFDQDERESDGLRHCEAIKSVLLRKFVRDESKISVTKCGYKGYLKAAQRKELSTVKTKMESYVIYELFKGILVGYLRVFALKSSRIQRGYEEREVNTRHKETWAASGIEETPVDSFFVHVPLTEKTAIE